MTHVLDEDLKLKQINQGKFSVRLSDCWSISGRPNGGYLMAVVANAMQQMAKKKHTPIITVNYVSACRAGAAEIEVEVIQDSGTFSRLAAKLVQGGEEKLRAFGTFCSVPSKKDMTWCQTKCPDMADFKSGFQVPVMPDNKLFDHIDLRLDPGCTGWITGALSRRAEFKGWLGFKQQRRIDAAAVFLFADTCPPPVFSKFGPRAWVPTIELSVNIREIPETKFLKGVFTSRFVSGGLVEEDGELWTPKGRLVAISRQVSKYRAG